MYKLFLLLKRVAVPMLFVVIEVLAVSYYTSATSFTRARLLTISNRVTSGVEGSLRSVSDYFGLKEENVVLMERLAALENELATYRSNSALEATEEMEGVEYTSPYLFTTARVIKNSVFGQKNFFTIDKGLLDDVEGNMALLSPEGYVVGYTIDCSEHFSVCMSVANRDFTMGGKSTRSEYMGSIGWLGNDYRRVQLTDIPYYANFAEGDTIVSTVSYRFPPGRVIGTVERFEATDDRMNSNVVVRLAADLSKLDKVLVVRYLDGEEFETLHEGY